MFTNLAIPPKTLCAAFALLAIGLAASEGAEAATARREAGGAVRFYDDYGQDRGYAWCLRHTDRRFAGWLDCSYFSYAQCRAASIGPPAGDCEPNPWAAYVTVAPSRKRMRR